MNNEDTVLIEFIAQAILNETMDKVYAVRELYSLIQAYGEECELFNYLSYLDSECEKWPIGKVRSTYSQDFLSRLDEQKATFFKEEAENLTAFCTKLVNQEYALL